MSDKQKQDQFILFFAKEADAIFRFCLIRVSDREVALDLTQDTFVRLWKALRGDSAIIINTRSFAFTIAHHLIIDWYRKKKDISLESLANAETGEPYERVSETAKADDEMSAEARFALDSVRKLSQSYRHIVYLRFVEGLSSQEIGAIVGLKAGTVSVRITRGIKELRDIMGYL